MRINMTALGWLMVSVLPLTGIAATSSDQRLLDAVKNQDAETARSLLKQHVDVNVTRPDGSTALAWAAHWNDVETAQLLIRAGANVNAANNYGDTPLWEACNNAGNAAMVEALMKAGANPNATLLRAGETALMRCARTGNVESVKSLLARGADVNAKEKGQTALMWAIEERHPEVARLLIEAGADVHAKSQGNFSPLLYAARQGDLATGRLLVERGADVNQTTQGTKSEEGGRARAAGGLSVLLVAADSGREEFARFLVEKGANPNATDSDGMTALHYALRKGISILRYVHHDNTYADSFDYYLFRPDMTELITTLLEHGADPNARVKRGTTLTSMLHPSDRPMLALPGATPFLLAAAGGDVPMMRLLLAKGADPKLGTNDGVTPLMAAAGCGRRDEYTKEQEKDSLEAVKLMVELGADVNAANNDGRTALQGAAFAGADSIIQFLVENGGRLDMENRWGESPLSIAEGDPNSYMDDHERCVFHETTVALIRKLGGDYLAQNNETASPQPVSAK